MFIFLSIVAMLTFLTYVRLVHDYDHISKFFEFAKKVAFYSIFVYLIILILVWVFSEKGAFVATLWETIFYCSSIFLSIWFIDVAFGQISSLSEVLGNPSLSPSISAWWVWGFFIDLYLIITYLLIKNIRFLVKI